MGAPPSVPPTTPLAEFRTLVVPPGRRAALGALAALALAALLPFTGDEYRLVLATDILVLALFASSLQFVMGTGGMASFGHAAYFGLGAYAAALAVKHGMPMEGALALSPLVAMAGALVVGGFCVRVSGVYLAMLTLAFAQIVWSIAFQWDDVTGGSNGVVGVWPAAVARRQGAPITGSRSRSSARRSRRSHGSRTRRSAIRCARAAIRRCAPPPSASTSGGRNGWPSRSPADSRASPAASTRSRRAAFRRRRSRFRARSMRSSWCCSAGSTRSPGPLLGAAAFTWLADTLARVTEYWHAVLGAAILLIVIAVSDGDRRRDAAWRRAGSREAR